MLRCLDCGHEVTNPTAFSIHNKARHRGKASALDLAIGRSPEPAEVYSAVLTHHLPSGSKVQEIRGAGFVCDCPIFRNKGVCGHIAEIIQSAKDTVILEDAVHFPLFTEPVVHCVVHLVQTDPEDDAWSAILITKHWMRFPYDNVNLGTVYPGVKRGLLRSMVISWLTSEMDDVLAGEKTYTCTSALHSGDTTSDAFIAEGEDPFSKIHLADLWGLLVDGKCIQCRDAEEAARVGV